MKKAIGIFAHVDAGKTTFSEQLLYHTHAIRTLGRVDHQNAFLDSHPLERERGITIFSGMASFSLEGEEYILVDTPGHADFSAEMERVLGVLDYAILIVSCAEGIQAHTETIWRLLRAKGIPTFLFLNKIDRPGADPVGVLQKLQEKFSPYVKSFDGEFNGVRFSGELCEDIAAQDDDLLALYLEGGYDERAWLSAARRLIQEERLFPCFSGSALQGTGIGEILSALHALTQVEFDLDAPLSGHIYQIRHDAKGNRLAFLRLRSGILRVKDEILGEKVNEIRRYQGAKYESVDSAQAGDIVAVTGLQHSQAGQGFGGKEDLSPGLCAPLFSSQVLFPATVPAPEAVSIFSQLADEDPSLHTQWNPKLGELRIQVMGKVQLEVLKSLAAQRYGLKVEFGPGQILYKETIAAPVMGYGHFEPLRHYAEVHLRLSPGKPGSGVTFESRCSTDVLDQNWQRLIRTHVLEKEHLGVLTGAPLTDVVITLVTGRAHLKHTEGGDFREATYRAIRQGLMSGESVLLEPILSFVIEVDSGDLGRVLFDIQRMQGEAEPPQSVGERMEVRGRAPAACMADYPQTLISATRGTGRISLRFEGYAPCHNAQEVIEAKGYDPERDVENTPDSVFCSHGAGYPVKWDQVPSHIHCK
ncbi:MAG: GTP-binding protein [Candidatus Pararuminococcus gallinarum]|jgi:ribosomal protection tetracycline resistance protein